MYCTRRVGTWARTGVDRKTAPTKATIVRIATSAATLGFIASLSLAVRRSSRDLARASTAPPFRNTAARGPQAWRLRLGADRGLMPELPRRANRAFASGHLRSAILPHPATPVQHQPKAQKLFLGLAYEHYISSLSQGERG